LAAARTERVFLLSYGSATRTKNLYLMKKPLTFATTVAGITHNPSLKTYV
jgi:hypothetical protein